MLALVLDTYCFVHVPGSWHSWCSIKNNLISICRIKKMSGSLVFLYFFKRISFTFVFLWKQGFSSTDKFHVIQRFLSCLWESGCNSNKIVYGLHRLWTTWTKCMGQYQFRGRSLPAYTRAAVSAGIFLVIEMECKCWKNTCCFGAFAAFGSGAWWWWWLLLFSSSKHFTAFFLLLRSSFKNLMQSRRTLWSLIKILLT